jgi:[NiFe] hydrogenase diaphorase moiety large subunit
MGNIAEVVTKAVESYQKAPARLLDVIRDVQGAVGQVSDDAIVQIARQMNLSRVDVEGVVTFYHFFSKSPVGEYSVYLNNSVVAVMMGRAAIAKSFEKETGCSFGSLSKDGKIGLFDTSCIGMNDQEPAAIINGVVFTNLTDKKVKEIVAGMKAGRKVHDMVKELGDGNNQSELVKSMVKNNIRQRGSVLFAPFESGSALRKAVSGTPEDVVGEIKLSELRGRGGAGFPTGMKWDFCRRAQGERHYVVCNADEGEPGTFKDRVILTEIPEMLFEGMAVAGYAVGAAEGILYLRAEYMYLRKFLEKVLDDLRRKNILGKNAGGKSGFDFDIKIQMGAGAYICGEESALIQSAEGKRGEPRNRPPFPVQRGYGGSPTTVNNVETLCAVCRIMVEGGKWFTSMGTVQSRGMKLLSVSGDCDKPGVYEVEWGITLENLLKMVGGTGAQAVVIGGPSGSIVGKEGFGKKVCYQELGTGGSVIVIGKKRDLLEIVYNFMEFFVEESCGYCVPCRAGNVILTNRLEKIMAGNGTRGDLNELEGWCKIVKGMSRCGLGQTSPNPILTTITNFRSLYEEKLVKAEYETGFDLLASVKESCSVANRKPKVEGH